jgi:hypothetical protein
MLKRPGERVASKRRVDFNQGVDARILCKDPMYLRELATIALKPLRIAFDHLGLRKPYEQAIRYSAEAGLRELSNYMLYNFKDDPDDLFERMWLNVALNEELDIRIWSFPMRYQPTDLPERTYVSGGWSRYELRSLQIVLQATHGVVNRSSSAEPSGRAPKPSDRSSRCRSTSYSTGNGMSAMAVGGSSRPFVWPIADWPQLCARN